MTPSQIVHEKAQIVFWWCGLAFSLMFFLGMWQLMHFIPPPSPTLTGEELVSRYQDNALQLRTGIIICILACSLMIPWSAGIAIQIARMERKRQYPLLASLSFGAGVANAIFFIIPFMFWAGAYYRLDRAPELIRLLNDVTWLEFVMIFPPFSIQWLCIAFAGFSAGAYNVFPRWFLYLCVWMSILGAPGVVALYFYEGPFAWNGLIGFWLPVGAYAFFLPCCLYAYYNAIRDHKNDLISDS